MKKYLLVILTIMLFFVSGCQKKDENITTKGTATIGEVKVIQDKAVINDLILTLQEDFIPMMEMTGLLISINQKDIKTNKDSYFEKIIVKQ